MVAKFHSSADSAEVGDVIITPRGRNGIKVFGETVCWRQPNEPEDWWLHRAANLKRTLESVADRDADGTLHPGGGVQ